MEDGWYQGKGARRNPYLSFRSTKLKRHGGGAGSAGLVVLVGCETGHASGDEAERCATSGRARDWQGIECRLERLVIHFHVGFDAALVEIGEKTILAIVVTAVVNIVVAIDNLVSRQNTFRIIVRWRRCQQRAASGLVPIIFILQSASLALPVFLVHGSFEGHLGNNSDVFLGARVHVSIEDQAQEVVLSANSITGGRVCTGVRRWRKRLVAAPSRRNRGVVH